MIDLEHLLDELVKTRDMVGYNSTLKNYISLEQKIKEQAHIYNQIYRKRDDLRFKSPQALVLEYGEPFLEKVESPFKGQIKGCYQNCFDALLQYPNLEYCEGYAIDDELPIAVSHAWLINPEGKVVDPTWTGKEYKHTVYYGIIFNREYVNEMAQINKSYSILENFYKNDHQILREGFPPHALHKVK